LCSRKKGDGVCGTDIGDSWDQLLSGAPKAALAFSGNFPVIPP